MGLESCTTCIVVSQCTLPLKFNLQIIMWTFRSTNCLAFCLAMARPNLTISMATDLCISDDEHTERLSVANVPSRTTPSRAPVTATPGRHMASSEESIKIRLHVMRISRNRIPQIPISKNRMLDLQTKVTLKAPTCSFANEP